jgi:hypothetical protein
MHLRQQANRGDKTPRLCQPKALRKGLKSMKLKRHKMIRLNVKADKIIAGKDPINPK